MRPRRPCRWRASSRLYRHIQLHRLERIRRGELEPRYEREVLFLWTCASRSRPRPEDFILPWPLFVAEHEAWREASGNPSGAGT